MIDNLIRLVEIRDIGQYKVCLHSNATLALHFEARPIDCELSDMSEARIQIANALKDLNPEHKVRIRSLSDFAGDPGFPNARRETMAELLAVETRLFFSIESPPLKPLRVLQKMMGSSLKREGMDKMLNDIASEFISSIQLNGFERSLALNPITDTALIHSFYHPEDLPIILAPEGLSFGHASTAIIKLQKLGTAPLSFMDLAYIRDNIALPFEFHFSARKLGPMKAQYLLSKRAKQEEASPGAVAATKYHETQSALEDVELGGTELFQFELALVLHRASAQEISEVVPAAILNLRRLGEFKLEVKGALNSYLATIPGSPDHFTLLERDEVLTAFLPVVSRGDCAPPSTALNSMIYHRENSQVSTLDLFHPEYESFSTVIIGQPGLGKSVFANTLLRSLLFDPDTRVILVDVRGSHTKTTERLGGLVKLVSLDEPSGINPLSQLNKDSSRDEIEIVANFIKQLVLNERETDLPVSDSFKLEELVRKYAESSPKRPSIDDFLNFTANSFSRPEHLMRWGKNSLMGNIFAGKAQSSESELKPRLTYYNFSQIMTASNRVVSSAVMAAVMAQFSLELLKKKPSEKLIFMADETPFFVQNCFASFRLLMKNVRKLNGSLVLIAQDHSDFVVQGDASLTNNAATKVLFSTDGDRREYRERLRLSQEDMETIDHLKGQKGKFSKFLLVDSLGSRVGTLHLTDEEYFFATTSAPDQHRLEQLASALPDFSETDLIRILSKLPRDSEIVSGAT